MEDLFQSGDAQNGRRGYGTCLPRLVIARTSQAWVIILCLSLGLLLGTFDTPASRRGARINADVVDAIIGSAGAVALGPCSVERMCSLCELDCGHGTFRLVRQGTVGVTGERQAACVKQTKKLKLDLLPEAFFAWRGSWEVWLNLGARACHHAVAADLHVLTSAILCDCAALDRHQLDGASRAALRM